MNFKKLPEFCLLKTSSSLRIKKSKKPNFSKAGRLALKKCNIDQCTNESRK